jgi:hypothetical protein
MANARVLLEINVVGQVGQGRLIELNRPGKARWKLELPVQLDQGGVVSALVAHVTAQYLVERPAEGVRLGWETVYALVRMALLDANNSFTQA